MREYGPAAVLLLLFLPQCQSADGGTGASSSAQRAEASPTDDVRWQVSQCWTIDLGVPGVENMVAEIEADLNPDGSVLSAEYGPSTIARLGDPNYRKFAESARRAVMKCSPLRLPKSLPYESWKKITFVFNPKEMLGQ